MPPAPFLLPGQGQSQELLADLQPAAPSLPGPPAVEFAPLQLAVAAEEGQLCAEPVAALPDCELVLEQGESLQRGGLAEELVPEGHLQESRRPGQLLPGPRLLHVSVTSDLPLSVLSPC